jgi:hypothetical protein
MPEITIDEAKRRHEDELLDLPNVTGVGIGERGGKPVIKVFVTEQVLESRVPASIEGYEVDVEEIGVIQAESAEEED